MANGQSPVPRPHSGQVHKFCSFLLLAVWEGQGCRKGWSTSTLATRHRRNFRQSLGSPPGGCLSPAPAWSQGLLRTSGPNPQGQGRKWVHRKESTGLGVGVSRLSLGWPQARPFYVLGLSFFIWTMRGQPGGLEKLEAQDENQNHLTINKLFQPVLSANLQPPNGLRLSCVHFTVQETETQVCMTTGLGRSRG